MGSTGLCVIDEREVEHRSSEKFTHRKTVASALFTVEMHHVTV